MKYRIVTSVILCMAVLAGCYAKKVDLSKVTESTIGINGDGTVDEVIIEDFDQSYYSLDELTAYVQDEVAAFNAAHPQKQPEKRKADAEEITAVTVQSVEEDVAKDSETKTARLALGYLDVTLYNAFNDTNLQFLTMAEAAGEDSIAGAEDLIAAKNGEAAAFTDIAGSEKLHVLCTNEPLRISTGGRIMYYSQGASLIDNYTVETAEGQSVIVFK